jgi:UDP-N-acetylmuramate--alanine ligase
MGIGGIGMSGLARWYLEEGHQVSGCDNVESPTVKRLRSLGITVHSGHHPNHLTSEMILIKNQAVPVNAPESQHANHLGIPVKNRIELLGDLFRRFNAIAITGSHGKSTTTGMIATIYCQLGLDPSVLIGAELQGIGGNMRFGRGNTLVAEVDESDPGFSSLESHLAVLTNLEDDHVAGGFSERRTYHATVGELLRATGEFADRADQLLFCADWPLLKSLFAGISEACTFGTSADAAYRISELELLETTSRFVLVLPEGQHQSVYLSIPGQHNALNAAAALSVAHLNGLDISAAADSLSQFTGVGRRWQHWGTVKEAMIIDDYAHHPTEIRATLNTARRTGRRIRAVLQPHRWVRTALHWPALADAASLADEVLLVDIYGAGERSIPGITPDLIVDRVAGTGTPIKYYQSLESVASYLSSTLAPNDLVITLGAGDVWKVAELLMEQNLREQ